MSIYLSPKYQCKFLYMQPKLTRVQTLQPPSDYEVERLKKKIRGNSKTGADAPHHRRAAPVGWWITRQLCRSLGTVPRLWQLRRI